MSRTAWRRIGGVLRCRLDVCLVFEREDHQESSRTLTAGQRMSAEDALDLFARPDPIITDGGVAPAVLLRSFSE